MKTLGIAVSSLVFALSLGTANADPWKDESGHRRGEHRSEGWGDRRERERRDWREHRDRDHRRGDSRGYHRPYAPPHLPPGHLPPPGEYRAWFPDRPHAHHPPPQRW